MAQRSDHLFMDISTIEYRDTNISFSVSNLLNNEYYPSSLPHPQKTDAQKQKGKPLRAQLSKHPKEAPPTPKNSKKEGEKAAKKEGRSALKPRDATEEKETQDNSETVKIVHCRSGGKQPLSRPLPKQPQAYRQLCAVLPSKKFQPSGSERCRLKSNASLKGRKVSQVSKEDFAGQAISSNISLKRNQSLKGRQRSETFRDCEELKMKNEHIVRNDYFEEGQERAGCSSGKLRTVQSKKLLVGKKAKKAGNQGAGQDRLNLKSPRLQKQ